MRIRQTNGVLKRVNCSCGGSGEDPGIRLVS